tara:strand:+ start:63 stop:320 length:258 start_codon:yes stop_codon:yes gene_type:complete
MLTGDLLLLYKKKIDATAQLKDPINKDANAPPEEDKIKEPIKGKTIPLMPEAKILTVEYGRLSSSPEKKGPESFQLKSFPLCIIP